MENPSRSRHPFHDSLKLGITSGVILSLVPFVGVFQGERTWAEAFTIWGVWLPLTVVSMTLVGYLYRKFILTR